jgi:hypothetical protein
MEPKSTLLSRIGQSWRSAFRDMVLIVVSITIAFTMDAWWDGRQERRREAGHRTALTHEFGGLRVSLQGNLADVKRGIGATRAILAEMGNTQSTPDADSLASLFNSSYDVGVQPPDGGALSAILSSGDIRLLQDDSLAYLLAEWPQIAEELRAENALLTASREQELRSRLIALGIPESFIARNLGDFVDLPPTRFRFEPRVILGDVGVESMLVSRLIRLRNIEEQLLSAVSRVERILGRLKKPSPSAILSNA